VSTVTFGEVGHDTVSEHHRPRRQNSKSALCGSSGWQKPAKYRHNEACHQSDYLGAHCHPVADRHFVSLKNPGVTVQNVVIAELGLSFEQAIPEFAAGIDAEINRDDASDDFTKEKLHSIRSSSAGSMTIPYCPSKVTAAIAAALPGLVWPDLGLVHLQKRSRRTSERAA
jgi:hypothetical protein